MSERVERVDLDLLLKLGDGVVVFQLSFVGHPKVVVSKLVIRIDLNLLFKGRDSLIVLIESKIGAAKIVPRRLVLGLLLHHPLQEVNRQLEVAVLEGLDT